MMRGEASRCQRRINRERGRRSERQLGKRSSEALVQNPKEREESVFFIVTED
jgi:hypothetical protein